MKDEYKRRRKVERSLIRTLPGIDPTEEFTPVHQESLNLDCDNVFDIVTQGQEFIAITTSECWLEVYGIATEDSAASHDLDTVSEISDDTILPNMARNALWRAIPRDPEFTRNGEIGILAPDVIGVVQPDTRGLTVSTWNLRTGQYLESIVRRGLSSFRTMCKISNTEFIVASQDGHLFSFEREGGCNLRETGRIWKAHTDYISSISVHGGTIVTTSGDWTARLWDAETKKRLAVLYHDGLVISGAISNQYIVTSSMYDYSAWEKRELRIYRNSEGHPLAKILRTHSGMFIPTLLDDGRVLCILRGRTDRNCRPLVRNTIVIVDLESERVLAQLKVGCRTIFKYKVLSDGRVVAISCGGCRGVVPTLPRKLARLISPETMEKQSKRGRRGMCLLMGQW